VGYEIVVPMDGFRGVRGRRPGQVTVPVGFSYEEADPRTLAEGGVPASLVLNLLPQLGPVSRFDLALEQLPVLGYRLDVPGFGSAHSNAIELSEEYRRKYVKGDPRAVGQLLGVSPGFQLCPWVGEARCNDPAVRRSLGPREGRPTGSRVAMDRGIAIARYVNALMESTGQSMNAVCKSLAAAGHIGVGYERIRQVCRDFGPEARGERRSALFFAGQGIPDLGLDW
jgi:hypothetical protein